MNPNLAAPYPEHQVPPTGPIAIEEVPPANTEWDQETHDRRELDQILIDLHKIPNFTAATPNKRLEAAQEGLNKAVLEGNDALAQDYRFQIADIQGARTRAANKSNAQMDALNDRFDTLIANSNPTDLLRTIYRQRSATTNDHLGKGDVAVHLEGRATSARDNSDDHEVRYTAATRYYANHPTTDASEQKNRERILREMNSDASEQLIKAGNARTAADDMARLRDQSAHLPAAVDALAQRLESRFAAGWIASERAIQDATHNLRSWDVLAGQSYPGQADDVRRQLAHLQSCIDRLPERDSSRAEAQADYVRLRYRFEERLINEGNMDGEPSRTAEYTHNRGILLYEGTAEQVVLHEDGSTERPDPATGEWVRTTANGEIWTPPAPTELVIDPSRPAQPLSTAFRNWEENRTPETAAEAYASLTEHINREGAIETRHTQNIHQMNTEIQNNDDAEVQYNDTIRENNDFITTATPELANNRHDLATINATLARESRGATRAENKEINRLNQLISEQEEEIRSRRDQNTNLAQSIRDLQADTVRLRGHITTETADRARVREGLNPARYWHGYLEINAERSVAEARGGLFGRFTVRREAQRATDALPAPPMMLADGSLIFDTAMINSRITPNRAEREAAARGDVLPSWQIWPDGTSARYSTDRRYRRETIYYRPNGEPFTHPVGVSGI
jgi:hypothetical protein